MKANRRAHLVAALVRCSLAALVCAGSVQAQVRGEAKISNLTGGFSGVESGDEFGRAVVSLGDLDGSGALHLAVAAPYTGPVGMATGSVFVLRLDAAGQVLSEVEIGNGMGGFAGTIDSGDGFGEALANLGDIDGDGVTDLAVGAPANDDVLASAGALWILRLNADGTVKATQKVSLLAGGAPATLPIAGFFGSALAAVEDVDGDGIPDLAATQAGGNGTAPAGVWILFLNADGTVRSSTRFGPGTAGFGSASVFDFGQGLAFLGDRSGTGIPLLAIGDMTNGPNGEGQVWITGLRPDGTNIGLSTFGEGLGGFPGDLAPGDRFGDELEAYDVDADGLLDLVVGAPFDSREDSRSGALWLVRLTTQGAVGDAEVVAEGLGGFGGILGDDEWFGTALCAPGDLDDDGRDDLLVGAPRADEGDSHTGALWTLYMSCPREAGVSARNGSGANASLLANLTDPVLGTSWDVDLDCSAHAPAFAAVVVYDEPFGGFFLAGGELLVDVTSALGASAVRPHAGGVVTFSLDIPDDMELCGYTGSAQGVVFGAPGYELSNALDALVGY